MNASLSLLKPENLNTRYQMLQKCRAAINTLSYSQRSLIMALAAFGCYTSMYAFRKAFAAGTFESVKFLSVDYKVWLVIAQIIGYTLSKFYGIKFISEIPSNRRARTIIILIGSAWLALLGFAIVPRPYNIIFLFLNGFPLGMIWGLVFSYLEGRKSTEFLGAVMATSLIFASGLVKTIGRLIITIFHVNEYWMPFLTGLVFVLPLLLFVFLLESVPDPDTQDLISRTRRLPMNAAGRNKFLLNFLPGIFLTLIIYTLFTIMRDIRDNFEVEIWSDFGVHTNSIYARIDGGISILILLLLSLLILVKDNLKAFSLIHLMIASGCFIIGLASILFILNLIGVMTWMTLSGLGLYMGYVPYNALFFDRMIANFRYASNVGFIMYIADSFGYLGSISVLVLKEFTQLTFSWGHFYLKGMLIVSVIGLIASLSSLIYFRLKTRKTITVSLELPDLVSA